MFLNLTTLGIGSHIALCYKRIIMYGLEKQTILYFSLSFLISIFSHYAVPLSFIMSMFCFWTHWTSPWIYWDRVTNLYVNELGNRWFRYWPCCLFGAKSLSEPVLTHFQLHSWNQTWEKIGSKLKKVHQENDFENIVCRIIKCSGTERKLGHLYWVSN